MECGAGLQDMTEANDRQLCEGQLLQALQLAGPNVSGLWIPHRLGRYDLKVWPSAVCKVTLSAAGLEQL